MKISSIGIVAAATLTLMATPLALAQDNVQFIQASAHDPGFNDTVWVTDARIFNPDAVTSITVTLAFLPAGSDNSNAEEIPVTVGPRRAVALDDLVASLFGEARAGAVRLTSSDEFLATSRTYNVGDGTSGTYGQFIAAVPSSAALTHAILIQVANDPEVTGSRTNLGLVNPTTDPCAVTVQVFDLETAVEIGSGTVQLPPLGFRQVNNLFDFVGAADTVTHNASVELAAQPGVLAYVSVVDNTSGDPIFVRPYADDGTPVTANNPPRGTITEPAGDVAVAVGESVSFAGSATDPDGDEVTVVWDFGDGMTSSLLEPGDHTYSSAGSFTVTLTATDDQGLNDPTPDSRTITVGGTNNPPDGVITQPAGDVTITAGESVYFAGSTSDPDGDQVTVLWDFGDGASSTLLEPGNHVYATAGSYAVTFTATDDLGLPDPTHDQRTITVQEAQNNPPDGVITQPAGDVSITAGESVHFAGSASDPDGDQVTVLWDFGDGITSTMLEPGNHTYSTPGVYTVTLTATDDQGLPDPSPDSRTVTVNQPSVTLSQVQATTFTPRCVSCHGGGSPEAGMDLAEGQAHANLVNVPATTQSGIRVVPFEPNSSVLVLFLESGHRNLPAAEIQAIRDWITAGAENN